MNDIAGSRGARGCSEGKQRERMHGSEWFRTKELQIRNGPAPGWEAF